ncbi:hypothetical protein LJC64_03305 [Ruminococcaceae bacterium OttesenSCG-928-A11]|nr:hypothetical protein [Ruminococcaceae bacterium OttesenSCG-928-A11]
MSGKNLAFIGRKLKKIKTWHMVVVFIILLISSLFLLRANSLNMVKYRDAVISADETLDEKQIEEAAKSLKEYVSRHMNTDTGLIPLQNLYNEAVSVAFSKENGVDSEIYAQATEGCKSVLSQKGYAGYSACVADFVGTSESNFNQPDLPNPALYHISFASPKWSPDFAGIVVLLTIVVFFAMILKLLTEGILALILNYREKR